jgi:hypothetical protein
MYVCIFYKGNYFISPKGEISINFYFFRKNKKAVFCSKQAKNGIYTEGSLFELKIKN